MNDIELVRSNSLYLEIPLMNAETNEEYIMQPEDVLTFTVKRNSAQSLVLLKKKVTGTNLIHIVPEDTYKLQPGAYVYDICLSTSNGDRYTVIELSNFIIKSDVGYYDK